MKLLVLLSRFPYPLDKGDKLRAYHQLRYLARHHEVCLFCLSDEDVPAAAYAVVQPLCAGGLHVQRLRRPGIARNMALASLRGLPLQVGYFYDAAAQRRLNALIREFRPDHVYCQLIRMAQYVRGYAGQLPMTLDYMDVFSTGMLRRAEQCRWAEQRLFRHEGRRLQAYEAAAFDWFQHHTIISDQDRQLIEHPHRQQIHIVRNGIDIDFFQPRPAEKTHDLLFCGNMNYHPNVDAAEFLALEILPLVRRAHPAARLLVAGTSPAPRVRALASEAVTISGWVEDIRDAYAAARVFVAPMRVGTGLQNKLLEAMAMELPCVTTPLANNALHGHPGQDLLVAESAAELADSISLLLTEPGAAARLAAQGRVFVQQHYDWQASTNQLEALFGQQPS
ncbi:glycosyltransferase [Hymenobacter sp. BT186]|uniref:Glycosyltransferase n=1 Tax=Hymenobacter telluris TaxID=2816474 RepID=A0A939J9N2_9BACT|nr:glycosyltransferase [Hymenobacter telluris]MBO0358989.1 glycosyltransferase [Hymenobacter telluris]MBW3375015.1 glycosyltransferase [Hymenobacter norwichensis]